MPRALASCPLGCASLAGWMITRVRLPSSPPLPSSSPPPPPPSSPPRHRTPHSSSYRRDRHRSYRGGPPLHDVRSAHAFRQGPASDGKRAAYSYMRLLACTVASYPCDQALTGVRFAYVASLSIGGCADHRRKEDLQVFLSEEESERDCMLPGRDRTRTSRVGNDR